jgi:hypothetical protein
MEEERGGRRKKAEIEAQLIGPSMVGDNDERCVDLFLTGLRVVMMMSSRLPSVIFI